MGTDLVKTAKHLYNQTTKEVVMFRVSIDAIDQEIPTLTNRIEEMYNSQNVYENITLDESSTDSEQLDAGWKWYDLEKKIRQAEERLESLHRIKEVYENSTDSRPLTTNV